MRNSKRIIYNDRLFEEDLVEFIRAVDLSRGNKVFYDVYMDLKSSIPTGFAASLINIALDHFERIARICVTSHPDSEAARVGGRLAYFCSSLVAASLDFISMEEPFKSFDERRKLLIDAVRFGPDTRSGGMTKLNLAIELVRSYATNGEAIASAIERRVGSEFDRIPAEVIADQSVKMFKQGQIFDTACALERACFSKSLPSFDSLGLQEKAFLGALLDFSDVDRRSFAKAWVSQIVTKESKVRSEQEGILASFEGLARNPVKKAGTTGSLFQEKS